MPATAEMADNLSFFLAPPARRPIADKLLEFGVRHHPELATMELSEPQGSADLGNWRARHVQTIRVDPVAAPADPAAARGMSSERVEQVRALTKVLAFIFKSPSTAPIAHKLQGLGFRVEPELATVKLPAVAGDRVRPERTLEGFLQWADPDLYAGYAAAKTDEQRAALLEQIRFKHGSKIADLEQRAARGQMDPGNLG